MFKKKHAMAIAGLAIYKQVCVSDSVDAHHIVGVPRTHHVVHSINVVGLDSEWASLLNERLFGVAGYKAEHVPEAVRMTRRREECEDTLGGDAELGHVGWRSRTCLFPALPL